MNDTFCKYVIDNGGVLKPLIIDSAETGGTGLMNPSIFVDEDNTIYVNIRHVNYTLYHSELNVHEHHWGPLVYLHPEDDLTLRTTNYFGKLDKDLNLISIKKIDTSEFDKPPLWEFINLEDARIVKWDNKFYITGVRRDVDTIGTGRMELSELFVSDTIVKEISRTRIPAPLPDSSYCEKNWMPISDKPYQYVKWSNPTEVVEYDFTTKETKTLCTTDYHELNYHLRGGSQVIPYKDGYLAINHITDLLKSRAGRKDGKYRHQFTYWDKNWNLIQRSKIFSFLDGKIEFCCGLTQYGEDYLITFGFQDNAAYVIKLSGTSLENFIYA